MVSRSTVALLLALAVACGGKPPVTKDPVMCERDPACAKARGAYADCSRQCVDEPECMDRCRQVQAGVDGLGHP